MLLRLLAIAALVALPACGPSTASTVTAPPTLPSSPLVGGLPTNGTWDTSKLPDPCRVITSAEVSNVIGTTTTTGRRLQSWPPLCDFAVGSVPQQGVYVGDDSAATGKLDFERRKQGMTTQEVPGIGDEAYWVPSIGALHILQGKTHLQVIMKTGTDESQSMANAVAIARIALPGALPK